MWQLVKKVMFSIIFGLILLNSQTDCLDWKFAVTTSTDIRFFYSNWTYTDHRIRNDNLLRGVGVFTYNGISDTLYYANNNVSLKQGQIYELKNFDYDGHPPPKLVIASNSIITGIAFDSLGDVLYWSNGHQIMQHNVISNKTNVFLEEPGKFPTDITLDICGRQLYYINQRDTYSTSIEQVNLDAPRLVNVIVDGLKMARSITVDYYSNKLYWLDNEGSTNVLIEEANFNGEEKRQVYTQSSLNPLHLTTDLNNIYYSSVSYQKVIRVGKHDEMMTIIDYDFGNSIPVDILMKHTTFEFEHSSQCKKVIDKMAKKLNTTEVIHRQRPNCKNNGIPNAETGKCICQSLFIEGDFCETNYCHNFCLNDGKCSMNIDRSMKCDCSPRYRGNRCEMDKCYEFCLHGGECSINKMGHPICTCETNKYSGDRCEKEIILNDGNYTDNRTETIQIPNIQKYENYCLNGGTLELKNEKPTCYCPQLVTGAQCQFTLCKDYCLNNGVCSLTGENPSCKCDVGLKGDRCEIKYTFSEIHQKSCNGDTVMANLYDIDIHSGVCTNFSLDNKKIIYDLVDQQKVQNSKEDYNKMDCSCMSSSIFVVTFGVVVSLVLILVIVIVLRKVYKPLRPKVKKTYVVRKNCTPLTNRPGGGTTEQCEITIEDCCNMNICETPCFDPKILQGCDSSNESPLGKKNELKRKEDKRKLLDADFSNGGELY